MSQYPKRIITVFESETGNKYCTILAPFVISSKQNHVQRQHQTASVPMPISTIKTEQIKKTR